MGSPEEKVCVPLKNILVATDFSPASEAALPQAIKIAGQYGSNLYIAHVICAELLHFLPADSTTTIIEDARRLARQDMESYLGAASQKGVPCQPLIGEGVIWDVLRDMIRENRIDLIVVGTRGRRGIGKLLLGSVTEEVFRLAPCPVLTVGPKTLPMRSRDVELSHVLYPLEFIPDTSLAATYAVSLAEKYHARLAFMKVFEESVPAQELDSATAEPARHWVDDHVPVGSDLRKRTSFEPAFGPAADAILKFATDRGVDLIVMGVQRFDPGISAHLPKSDTAYEVVRAAPCPVLTVG